MSTRTTIIVVLVLLFVSTLAGVLLWNKLPDPMASHWGINNQVNGTTPKFWGVFLMPIISLAMLSLFLVIPEIDPLKANIAKFRDAFNLFIAFIMLFLTYLYGLLLAWNLGFNHFQMSQWLLPALGFLFILVGYMIRKAKRNFFIGIRTPWTLSSDRVWDETHRVGSWLFIVMGIITMFTGLLGQAGIFVMFAAILVAVLVPVIYSYVLYQQETSHNQHP